MFEMHFNQILEHVQINNMVLAAAGNGVITGLAVSERGAGANMSVDVATGSALLNGTTYSESSVTNLTIAPADGAHARKDLIIYDSATSNPTVLQGTPATPAFPPDISSGDILLAIVEVAACVAEITNSEITDCAIDVVTGGSLDGLSNVLITSVADKEILTWNSASSKWINQTAAELGLAALAGFTMAGDIDMAGNEIDNLNQIDSYLSVGTDVHDSGGTRRIALASTSSAFTAYDDANMNSHKVQNLSNPTASQDAATMSWVDAHNWATTDITSGTLPISRGGTGVTSASVVASVNATMVDSCSAGASIGNVWKLPTVNQGTIPQHTGSGITGVGPGVSGYQLTTYGTGAYAMWSAASDLLFSDTHCPKCGQELQDGDDLILHVIGHNEVGDILTVPMHLACANKPKKSVLIKRKVMEDRYTINEDTGELQVQRVHKQQEKTATKRKLKEGFIIDAVTGKAHKLNDSKPVAEETPLPEALETTEETISEDVYEEVEYRL